MPDKIIIDGLGDIKLIRNPRSKTVKIKISHDGQPEITAPPFVPAFAIKKFVSSKSNWIKQNIKPELIIDDGSEIGTGYKVKVVYGEKFMVKRIDRELRVYLKNEQDVTSKTVQQKVEKAAVECLREQAQKVLPESLEYWKRQGVGDYNNVRIKLIRSRWGSYSSDGNINLSLFLIQLPQNLIDYVLIHELSHSVHMNHSKDFWLHVSKYMPEYKKHRKNLKDYHMRVYPH